ncbi:MAG TPA: VOC family protein [Nitrososphaeraceae archaeon]
MGEEDTAANIAVKTLETAKKFYEDILGLKVIWTQDQEVIVFKSGNSTINVYRSQYAGTNQATAITWNVGDDIEEIVQHLKAKGVIFEHYDNIQGVTRKGDIHVTGNMKADWFKDLDGNIPGIASG